MKRDKSLENMYWFIESLKTSKKECVILGVTGFITGVCLFLGFSIYTSFILLAFLTVFVGIGLNFFVGLREVQKRVKQRLRRK